MKILAPALVLVALLSTTCLGAVPATQPATPHGFVPAPRSDIVEDLDVPAGLSVAELLQRVKRETPSFQYVAAPGVWEKAPLPQMKLHNVSLQQIVGILGNLVPNVRTSSVSDGLYNVYVFQSLPNRTDAAASGTDLGTFGLAEPVEELGLSHAWAAVAKDQDAPTAEQIAAGRKKGMSEVLSLLEAAATQADPSVRPSLKLHEETEVLLVTGTPVQLNAVSQSLKALQSSQAINQYTRNYAALADRYQYAKHKAADLQSASDSVDRANKSLAQRISELEKENTALRNELRRANSSKAGSDEKH